MEKLSIEIKKEYRSAIDLLKLTGGSVMALRQPEQWLQRRNKSVSYIQQNIDTAEQVVAILNSSQTHKYE